MRACGREILGNRLIVWCGVNIVINSPKTDTDPNPKANKHQMHLVIMNKIKTFVVSFYSK